MEVVATSLTMTVTVLPDITEEGTCLVVILFSAGTVPGLVVISLSDGAVAKETGLVVIPFSAGAETGLVVIPLLVGAATKETGVVVIPFSAGAECTPGSTLIWHLQAHFSAM